MVAFSENDRNFLEAAARELRVPVPSVQWSNSKARWPDIWTDGQVIWVTREWARQLAPERRKRLIHEMLHLKGLEHGPVRVGSRVLEYSTLPRKDGYSQYVYQRMVARKSRINPTKWIHQKRGVGQLEKWLLFREGDPSPHPIRVGHSVLYVGIASGTVKHGWKEPTRFDASTRDFFVGTFSTLAEAKRAVEISVQGIPSFQEHLTKVGGKVNPGYARHLSESDRWQKLVSEARRYGDQKAADFRLGAAQAHLQAAFEARGLGMSNPQDTMGLRMSRTFGIGTTVMVDLLPPHLIGKISPGKAQIIEQVGEGAQKGYRVKFVSGPSRGEVVWVHATGIAPIIWRGRGRTRKNPERTPKADVAYRKVLLKQLEQAVSEGRIPTRYLSGAMYLDTEQLEDIFKGRRNPFVEALVSGLGAGIGFAGAKAIANGLSRRRSKNPTYTFGPRVYLPSAFISDLGPRRFCPEHKVPLLLEETHRDKEGEVTHWDARCPKGESWVVYND